ncbi:SAICAR synthase-like protein [Schizopora paradoxa]|uniref:1-phosphatidylinositol-4-phosphate 5-kinase n=1 Tax=Schizopora paradoxa TaxID=27342 RepID=A0A0H2S511_9AGAM|nr:SAICAR synthase-like protein [Schizopora paradoxa]
MAQAHQIRRERESKRRHQEEQDAEAEKLGVKGDGMQVIGEGHVNYVLMYNMLSGIRTCVSRCGAKISRPLTDDDFKARHKFSFDIYGNELTPSAKYDFKFKDYAPWVFRELRENYFCIDPADYLVSLTGEYKLNELLSPGKSGSFFYFSKDLRFIIKTIHHTEHKFLLRILKEYYTHVKQNPHTLISRFYGLHRVKLPHGRKIHFVVMNNIFPADKVYEKFDLKGSEVGREYPEEKAALALDPTLKDLNWIKRGRSLELGPEKGALFEEQLRRDTELLKSVNVMDYSLLVGIYKVEQDARDTHLNRRGTMYKFSPPQIKRKPTTTSKGSSPEAAAMRKAVRTSAPERVDASGSGSRISEEDASSAAQADLFHEDEGGLRARDDYGQPLERIYYLGVIDILTPYNTRKKLEHLWKGLQHDSHKISPVPAVEYGNRFFDFIRRNIRGVGKVESSNAEAP